ncbi:WD40 repeat-like protein [Lophium mytilinum]|uniref:methylated diphthine methylhydrolase n=1 Tax=Lophium mytilinum TaxID=390894 RepID=A0A6A6QCU4_9PEZI|nr:WD40 repeat-like protein [Lophium mytilinum]
MASVASIDSLVLDLPPSCVEFWPLDPEYAVVGTYNLEQSNDSEEKTESATERPQSRNGSLILIHSSADLILSKIVQTLSTPFAILDVHFTPTQHGNPHLIGAASSTGSLALYELRRPDSNASALEHQPQLEHVQTLQYVPENTLITAFAWHPTSANVVGITLSSGEVMVCSTKGNDAQANLVSLPSHELEAWTLAFQPDGNGLLSGGDDSVLRYCKMFDEQMDSRSTWADRRIHGAGVTAVLPLGRDIVITGSYDDHIRIIHAPSVGRKIVLAEMNLGGGVWRLKTLSEPATLLAENSENSVEVLLLVSCMHAGARIVKILKNLESWSFEVLAKFEEHKSMNYGSDVQPNHHGKSRTLISTSFYDRLICLWSL